MTDPGPTAAMVAAARKLSMPEPSTPVDLLAPAPDGLQVLPVVGLPDFRPGDDLAAAIDRQHPGSSTATSCW